MESYSLKWTEKLDLRDKMGWPTYSVNQVSKLFIKTMKNCIRKISSFNCFSLKSFSLNENHDLILPFRNQVFFTISLKRHFLSKYWDDYPWQFSNDQQCPIRYGCSRQQLNEAKNYSLIFTVIPYPIRYKMLLWKNKDILEA